MSNITPQGWESQSVEAIVSEITAEAELIYGTDFPTTPDSFAGQLFNVLAAQEKKIQDLGQAITTTQNLSSAEGIYLDYIADHKNTRRFRASGSTGSLLITGLQGTTVTANTPFKDVTSRVVLTTEDVTINRTACYQVSLNITTVADNTDYIVTLEGVDYSYTSGTGATQAIIVQGIVSALQVGSSLFTTAVDGDLIIVTNITRSNTLTVATSTNVSIPTTGSLVDAESVIYGAATYPANSINTIVINSLNINSVTNPFDFVSGRFEETDPELRARLEQTSDQAGVATIPAMQASLTNLDGVSSALIVDNKTDIISASGIPPRSFEAFVVGGADQEVGEKLFEIQPAGISTHGNITVQFNDVNGDPQTTSFSRKASQVAWVEVDYSLNLEESFPADGEDLMTATIVSQGNGMYSGEDFVPNKFMGACYSVEGMYVNTIRIAVTESGSDTPTYQTTRIPINSTQSLSFSPEKVTFINT
ncbi:baseplate wedge subunit [Vibrio phage K460]